MLGSRKPRCPRVFLSMASGCEVGLLPRLLASCTAAYSVYYVSVLANLHVFCIKLSSHYFLSKISEHFSEDASEHRKVCILPIKVLIHKICFHSFFRDNKSFRNCMIFLVQEVWMEVEEWKWHLGISYNVLKLCFYLVVSHDCARNCVIQGQIISCT